MIDPRDLYEAHMSEVERLLGDPMPMWHELNWQEKDYWQSEADSLNEAREPLPDDYTPL